MEKIVVVLKAPPAPAGTTQVVQVNVVSQGVELELDPLFVESDGYCQFTCTRGDHVEAEVVEIDASGNEQTGPLLSFKAGAEHVKHRPGIVEVVKSRPVRYGLVELPQPLPSEIDDDRAEAAYTDWFGLG